MKPIYNSLYTFFIAISLISSFTFSQQRPQFGGSVITGTVIDSVTKAPIEYANILLFSAESNKMVTGIATGKDGKFELTGIRPGSYYAEIQFLGFKKKRISNIQISPNSLQKNLGTIALVPTEIKVGDVYVEGERAPMSYQIDKKVVDVSQMQTAISGSAVDVLQNVPSVTVDAEGNVSLRGSSDFTVLIDGRPSILDPQDALQQIPATSIKTIEIITNPSAKYDPEGTSGIINVILKKTENAGLTGVLNINAGLNDKYGGDFLFEYKASNYSLNFGADYNRRFSPGTSRREDSYTVSGNTSTLTSNGNNRWGREFWGLRGGIEFIPSKEDILSLDVRFGSREMKRTSNLTVYELSPSVDMYYINTGITNRKGNFYNFNTNYTHIFNEQGHEIKAMLTYGNRTGDETSSTESLFEGVIKEGKKNYEKGPSERINGKIEYTLPLKGKNKLEAGYEGQLSKEEETTELYKYDTTTYSYNLLSSYSHNTKSNIKQHSLFSLYSNEWNGLGIQLGIRGEYTYRFIELTDQNSSFKIDDWNLFPTFHTSFRLNDATQFMGSYTRRIQRPMGWALEPFLTWIDANNVQKGNPELKNEYVDSYEIGAQTSLGKAFLSAEIYYRLTSNKIERISSAYSDAPNVTLTTFENVGKDYSIGTEIQLNSSVNRSWTFDIMGNLYQYKIKGILANEAFSRESFNWSIRFNNTFKFGPSTQIQINTTYNSPSVYSQGRRESSFTTDFSLRQDLFQKTVSAILQVRDIFQTGRFKNTTNAPGYSSLSYFSPESPVVMLNIKYYFNNYAKERKPERIEERIEEEEEPNY